nr:MAG TPA: hypothetical protein [Caudoviricetes sp.]
MLLFIIDSLTKGYIHFFKRPFSLHLKIRWRNPKVTVHNAASAYLAKSIARP